MGEVIRALDNSTTVRELMRPLAVFLERSDVTEVAINEPGRVWVMAGSKWEPHDVPVLTAPRLMALANAMAVYGGVTLTPMLDVELPDGERAHVTLPPACVPGQITFNIRKHVQRSYTLEQLEGQGAFADTRDASFNKPDDATIERLLTATDMSRITPREAQLLRLKAAGKWREFLTAAVVGKFTILTVGATGSGKTTFNRALVKKIPADERLITAEDVHEMILDGHPNTVHLLYSPDGAGEGRITATQALMACMRMSPDRILLAELRGDEASVYVNSLNTGHPGAMTTVHANSAISGYSRVADLIKDSRAGGATPKSAIQRSLYEALQVVVYMERFKVVEVFFDPIFARAASGDTAA